MAAAVTAMCRWRGKWANVVCEASDYLLIGLFVGNGGVVRLSPKPLSQSSACKGATGDPCFGKRRKKKKALEHTLREG